MATSRTRITAFVIVSLTAIVAAAAGSVLYSDTLTAWWQPATWSAGIAIATLPIASRAWQRIVSHRLAAGFVHVAYTGILCWCVLLGINRAFPQAGSEHEVTVTVTDRHSEQHTRYRRVGRGRMVPSGTYNTYHAGIVFPDGTHRSMEISYRRYMRLKKGSKTTFTVSRGALGYPVITSHGSLNR